jgi:hypothetical protein
LFRKIFKRESVLYKMKKVVFGVVLGILLVSLVSFVLAQGNGTNDTGTSVCDSDNLNLCLDETNCTGVGGYWYNDVCNEEEEEIDEDQNDTGNGNGGAVVTRTRTREAKRLRFVPWQKRNESECLEGCKCVGAVMSCPTETGKTMTITAGRSGNTIVITIDKSEVETELEIEAENETDNETGVGRNKTRLRAKLSNGQTKEIKIMPDVASQRALERLRLRTCSEENCTIELKEVEGKKDKQLAYELQAERHSRILGMFRKKMQVKAQVDAETGELIRVKKPWWAFLASEPEE